MTTGPTLPGNAFGGRASTRQPGSPRSVVLGTAGHIDHGKTSLVLALTGVNADRLPEEKARGITIDIGFASMDLTGSDGQRLEVSLIDVPGHHAFIRNMLAGAGGTDAVLLVVAADDGVKAQTREHLQICRLLGIQHGLVVLTKRDAVSPERLSAATQEVRQLVQGTFLEGAPVVSVSALASEGIDGLKTAIAALLAAIPTRNEGQVARLPIDRVFSMRGFGTVVTGTLQAGTFRAGESPSLQPGDRRVRVRGVQVHGKSRNEASAPNRVALNLAGIEVAEVQRGDTVVPQGTLEPVSVLDAEIEVLPGATALRHRQRVRMHAFTSESLATVLLYEAEPTNSPVTQNVRLRLSKPMLLVPGDRFVLRQPSPAETLGGGRVLDAHPLERLPKAATAKWLRRLQDAHPPQEVLLRVERRGAGGLTLPRLIAETGRNRGALQGLLGPLLAGGLLVQDAANDALIAAEALTSTQQQLLKEVVRAGVNGTHGAELRSRLGLQEWVFTRSIAALQADRRLQVRGDLLTVPQQGSGKTGTQAEGGRAVEVERLYLSAGLAPPLVNEAAERLGIPSAELRGYVTALLRAGRLVRLGADTLLVHQDALGRLIGQLQQERGQSVDVGGFKKLTGLTRKHAIPLLEYLDGARVTRNTGGVRVVL